MSCNYFNIFEPDSTNRCDGQPCVNSSECQSYSCDLSSGWAGTCISTATNTVTDTVTDTVNDTVNDATTVPTSTTVPPVDISGGGSFEIPGLAISLEGGLDTTGDSSSDDNSNTSSTSSSTTQPQSGTQDSDSSST